jgi:hypothetical protein
VRQLKCERRGGLPKRHFQRSGSLGGIETNNDGPKEIDSAPGVFQSRAEVAGPKKRIPEKGAAEVEDSYQGKQKENQRR